MKAPAVIIRVKSTGGDNVATVAKGPQARASCTMSPAMAATRCAAKSLRCSEERVALKEVSCENNTHLYEATLREQPDLFAKGAAS